MAYVKDLSDIPLKPLQETFVDDPTSLEEIYIDELIFDLEHKLKNINKLSIFHAIYILSQSVQNIIKLQSDPVLFQQFKNEQLANHEFTRVSSHSLLRSHTPPLSPPLKFAKLSQPIYPQYSFKESTPDSLANEEVTPDSIEEQEPKEPPYIPIKQLVKELKLDPVSDPVTNLNLDSFKKEVLFNRDSKRIEQNQHLLKIFNLVKVPPLTIDEFLLRIKTYSSSISVSAYIHTASMMFKLCILLDIIPLSPVNVYRFILASLRCSTKKLEDVYQKQKSFATVGGVSTRDLYRLEVGFLYLCNFKLVLGEATLNKFLNQDFVDLHTFVKENYQS
ncbi:predicted protein [Scheffersomyces stipitis CBS 6054]|uniref:Uncharacterized protein n=1 Tax=Scheffersomyces stipitis (strain ATCC 58785 / CBS 6054 / NBRC 10063 / NRRL Y-11545) TaxID=322104 RepID=A3LUF1_PICST|nr:predicted protein [Scheffersomyces stipitis CBS 6054]ABN66578.2 predicted protein [Scheffersomyces stipitis CBS 6054]